MFIKVSVRFCLGLISGSISISKCDQWVIICGDFNIDARNDPAEVRIRNHLIVWFSVRWSDLLFGRGARSGARRVIWTSTVLFLFLFSNFSRGSVTPSHMATRQTILVIRPLSWYFPTIWSHDLISDSKGVSDDDSSWMVFAATTRLHLLP